MEKVFPVRPQRGGRGQGEAAMPWRTSIKEGGEGCDKRRGMDYLYVKNLYELAMCYFSPLIKKVTSNLGPIKKFN